MSIFRSKNYDGIKGLPLFRVVNFNFFPRLGKWPFGPKPFVIISILFFVIFGVNQWMIQILIHGVDYMWRVIIRRLHIRIVWLFDCFHCDSSCRKKGVKMFVSSENEPKNRNNCLSSKPVFDRIQFQSVVNSSQNPTVYLNRYFESKAIIMS